MNKIIMSRPPSQSAPETLSSLDADSLAGVMANPVTGEAAVDRGDTALRSVGKSPLLAAGFQGGVPVAQGAGFRGDPYAGVIEALGGGTAKPRMTPEEIGEDDL